MTSTTDYRFGIEEELFLADADTRGTPRRVKPFHAAVRERMPEVERELLVSQVEIMTPPCIEFTAARECLSGLRAGLAEIGGEHGIRVFGGGSHPTANWRRQARTRKDRYDAIADDMRMLARRDSHRRPRAAIPSPRRSGNARAEWAGRRYRSWSRSVCDPQCPIRIIPSGRRDAGAAGED